MIVEKVLDLDRTINQKFTDHRLGAVDQFFASVTGLGSTYLTGAIITGTYILRPGLLGQVLPGFVALSVIVWSSKKLFHRDKPDNSTLTVDLTESFPSGHSANSVYMAVTYSFLFPELAVLAYGLAVTICLSRVYLGAHYPSDVVAGASLGAVIAILI